MEKVKGILVFPHGVGEIPVKIHYNDDEAFLEFRGGMRTLFKEKRGDVYFQNMIGDKDVDIVVFEGLFQVRFFRMYIEDDGKLVRSKNPVVTTFVLKEWAGEGSPEEEFTEIPDDKVDEMLDMILSEDAPEETPEDDSEEKTKETPEDDSEDGPDDVSEGSWVPQ